MFGTIKYAIDHGRNLTDVLSGKKLDKKVSGLSLNWNGESYYSYASLYRAIYRKRKRAYISRELFRVIAKEQGLEEAIRRVTRQKITRRSISIRLGGKHNLIALRLKYGWSYERATTEKCHKKNRKIRRSN